MSIETLVLIPAEFGLAPMQVQCESTESQNETKIQRYAVHSEQHIAKGAQFLPFQGIVRFGHFPMEPYLSQHHMLHKFGSFDLIQEIDSSRHIRQCNWVRFLIDSEQKFENYSAVEDSRNINNGIEFSEQGNLEPNMIAMFVEGQPIFEVTKSIVPHTLIVVQFTEKLSSPISTGFSSNVNSEVQKCPIPSITTTQDSPLDLSKSLLETTKPSLCTASASGTNNRIRLSHRSLLPCEVCGKVFDRPSLLKRHMRTHTGEKPHICEVCSKGFSTSSSLNTHRRIHSGDKPHQCLVCGKRFTASSNLYYHRMTHTKEKPHKCSQCSKSFPTPGDLKAHMYIHSGSWPFRCHVCSRGFSKQTNLRNHLFLHTGDRPYPCNNCGKKFALACNLRAHIKTHHHNADKTMINKEGLLEQRRNITLPCYEDKIKFTSSTNESKNYKWHESGNKQIQSTLITPDKCTLPQPELDEQLPSCPLLNMSLENKEIPLHSLTCTDNSKKLFQVNSSNCALDKSTMNSDQFHRISRLGYANILEETWPGHNAFINQCNVPFSVLQAPFNINMPCLTSISLVDLQALLLMQAANMAMLQGGNITYNDVKSLKKQMTEPAQNRSILLV